MHYTQLKLSRAREKALENILENKTNIVLSTNCRGGFNFFIEGEEEDVIALFITAFTDPTSLLAQYRPGIKLALQNVLKELKNKNK